MNPRQWNWSLHLTEKWDMINYGLLAVAWTQRRRHVMPFQINFPAALFHQLPLKLFWKGSLVDQISSVLSPGKALPICVLCQNCNDKLKKKQIETFVHDQRDDGAGISTDSKEDVPLTDVDQQDVWSLRCSVQTRKIYTKFWFLAGWVSSPNYNAIRVYNLIINWIICLSNPLLYS